MDSPSVSLDELWAREDMGCVFMCGYPYALRADRPCRSQRALAARPGMSPTSSCARDGPHQRLEDTFGGTSAYSTELLRFDRVIKGDFQLFLDCQRAVAAGYAKLWQMVGAR